MTWPAQRFQTNTDNFGNPVGEIVRGIDGGVRLLCLAPVRRRCAVATSRTLLRTGSRLRTTRTDRRGNAASAGVGSLSANSLVFFVSERSLTLAHDCSARRGVAGWLADMFC